MIVKEIPDNCNNTLEDDLNMMLTMLINEAKQYQSSSMMNKKSVGEKYYTKVMLNHQRNIDTIKQKIIRIFKIINGDI